MGVERFMTTEKVSTRVTAVVGQVIDAVSAVLRYHTSLSKDDKYTLFTALSPIVPVMYKIQRRNPQPCSQIEEHGSVWLHCGPVISALFS